MSELRIKLIELAVQGGATIENAQRVASDWEGWISSSAGVPPQVVDGIDARMKLISPQLESLLRKLNTFSEKRSLSIENSDGTRLQVSPTENTIDGILDAIMDFPIEMLSDATWGEIGPENPGETVLPAGQKTTGLNFVEALAVITDNKALGMQRDQVSAVFVAREGRLLPMDVNRVGHYVEIFLDHLLATDWKIVTA